MSTDTQLIERLNKKAAYTDEVFNNHSLGKLYREAATALTEAEAKLAKAREVGQREGFAAAVSWLRERSAMKPPAPLHHAASLLTDQMEQSCIPARACLAELGEG